MAEVIGVVGSIAGIASVAAQSAQTLVNIIEAIKESPKIILAVNEDLRAIHPVLCNIAERAGSQPIAFHDQMRQSLINCSTACIAFQATLVKVTKGRLSEKPSWGDRLRFAAFCQNRVPPLRAQLESCKSTLTLALLAGTSFPPSSSANENPGDMSRVVLDKVGQSTKSKTPSFSSSREHELLPMRQHTSGRVDDRLDGRGMMPSEASGGTYQRTFQGTFQGTYQEKSSSSKSDEGCHVVRNNVSSNGGTMAAGDFNLGDNVPKIPSKVEDNSSDGPGSFTIAGRANNIDFSTFRVNGPKAG